MHAVPIIRSPAPAACFFLLSDGELVWAVIDRLLAWRGDARQSLPALLSTLRPRAAHLEAFLDKEQRREKKLLSAVWIDSFGEGLVRAGFTSRPA
jgi:hypothetical protein